MVIIYHRAGKIKMNWEYFIYKPIKYFFRKGFFVVESEAFFMTIAFAFFIYWIIKELNKEKLELEPKDLFWFMFMTIFGTLAGGRLWYYLENWKGPETIMTIFNLHVAGLTSYGMIIGGIISISLFVHAYNKKSKIEKDWKVLVGKYLDIIAIATALFIFIYRMGCFHYGDVPSIATKLPWGMFTVQYGKYTGIIMHPAALYLSFSALIIFLFLNWYKKKGKFSGEIGSVFLITYSFTRFLIEFLRAGERTLGLNRGQFVLVIIFIISILIFISGRNKKIRPLS